MNDLPRFDPPEAITHFDRTLRDIAGMVYPPLPRGARLVKVTVPASGNAPARTDGDWMWLAGQDAQNYDLVDSFGQSCDLSKAQATLAPASLAQWGRRLLDLRAAEARDPEAVMAPSPQGDFSGQFEPEALRLPEALVAAWAYVRGDRATAAAVLLPRVESLPDERWLREIARDMLGHGYDERMLTDLVDRRDYAAALAYAKHLSSPLFAGFEFQDRAEKLRRELPGRMKEDFITLALPTPAQWDRLTRDLPRAAQIRYLADRLRLLNVRQPGWPMDMQFCDPQRSVPMGGTIYTRVDFSRGEPRINPFRELVLMRLEPADLRALLPYVAEEDYALAYHVWRPWSPTWHLFQVNELVAQLANEAAGMHLVDLGDYYARPPAEQPAYIARLQQRAELLHGRLVRAGRCTRSA